MWACRFVDGRWSDPEPVSDTDGPSFNQEVAASEDGGLHVCWQGRAGGRFAVFARRWNGSGWEATARVSDGDVGQRLGPEPRDRRRGLGAGVAYAWTEYVDGSYAVAVRRIDAHGGAGPVRRLTGGSDYALHPSLATTTDGRLWCAFDVVSVQGHGGSGPTRLRPRPGRGRAGPTTRTACGSRAGACRPSSCPRSARTSGWSGSTATGWWSRPASWRAG